MNDECAKVGNASRPVIQCLAILGFAHVDFVELLVNFFDHVLVDVRENADRCERLGGIRHVHLMIWHGAIDFEGGSGVGVLVGKFWWIGSTLRSVAGAPAVFILSFWCKLI